ncbi:hypothetical protein [uncultured Albimonas sp.]
MDATLDAQVEALRLDDDVADPLRSDELRSALRELGSDPDQLRATIL